MAVSEHGGTVQAIEASQWQAKCYCGWQSIKKSHGEADYALNSHVTKAVFIDPKGKQL